MDPYSFFNCGYEHIPQNMKATLKQYQQGKKLICLLYFNKLLYVLPSDKSILAVYLEEFATVVQWI